jgi:hypothetical protein
MNMFASTPKLGVILQIKIYNTPAYAQLLASLPVCISAERKTVHIDAYATKYKHSGKEFFISQVHNSLNECKIWNLITNLTM